MPHGQNWPHTEFKYTGTLVQCNIKQGGFIVASGIGVNAPEALLKASKQLMGQNGEAE